MYIPAPDSRYPTVNSARLAVLALSHSTNMCKHNAFYSIHVFRLSLFSAIIYLTAIRSHAWVRYTSAHVLHFCHFFRLCSGSIPVCWRMEHILRTMWKYAQTTCHMDNGSPLVCRKSERALAIRFSIFFEAHLLDSPWIQITQRAYDLWIEECRRIRATKSRGQSNTKLPIR